MSCCPEYVKKSQEPAEVQACIAETFGEDVSGFDLRAHVQGVREEVSYHSLWFTVVRERFIDLIDYLGEFDFPHFHIISGNDDGDSISLNYHMGLFRSAGRGKRLHLCITIHLPKNDLVMPSLHSRIPGVEYSEREMIEMMGVDFEGLPNKAHVFLPENWNDDIKPWRRDETGPGPDDVRELS
jgi:membrane-bound hydrogenase subunit beta